jgi:hypothetical protein
VKAHTIETGFEQEESMYVRASAPRTIGGVLDDAISLYRNSYASVWPFTLAAAVVVAIPGAFLGLQLAHARTLGPQAILAMMKAPSYWLTYALIVVFHVAIYGALLSALNSFIERGQASLGAAFATGMSVLPRMLAVSVLFGLMVAIGLVVLIVPGIYLSGIYQLAVVVLIVERAGVSESFGSSRRLIRGYWWRSAAIITVAIIIVFVFSLIGGMVNGLAVGLFGFGTSFALLDQAIVGIVLNAFLLPLLPCFLLAMYYDLKLRHEGGDLAAGVDALAAR